MQTNFLSDGFSGKNPTSDHWTDFLIGYDFTIVKFDPWIGQWEGWAVDLIKKNERPSRRDSASPSPKISPPIFRIRTPWVSLFLSLPPPCPSTIISPLSCSFSPLSFLLVSAQLTLLFFSPSPSSLVAGLVLAPPPPLEDDCQCIFSPHLFHRFSRLLSLK